MYFYYIKDEYINFLKQFDSKVLDNKYETRPYVGIVFTIGHIDYFAPFSSPKEKHKKMVDKIDFIKIKNGTLGAINLNNMIPVLNKALLKFDFKKINNVQYRRLLQNQYYEIKLNEAKIRRFAEKLRILIFTENDKLNNHNIKIKERCCNLVLLEKIYKDY